MRRVLSVIVPFLILSGCAASGDGEAKGPTPQSSTVVQAQGSSGAVPEDQQTVAPTKPPPSPTQVATEGAGGQGPGEPKPSILLVNREHLLSDSYRPAGVGKWGLTAETNAAINELIAAAEADGVAMQVRSGYRSYADQKATYEHALRTYSDVEEAKRFNAPPGGSEHQTGLAVDMWDGRNRGWAFRGTPTDTWLSENAYRFGFIIRYPVGKEAITGYHDEPWHLRYVGVEVAAKFGPRNTLTLEEYLGVV